MTEAIPAQPPPPAPRSDVTVLPGEETGELDTEALARALDHPERPPVVARLTNRASRDLYAAAVIAVAPALLLHQVFGWRGWIGTAIWWYLAFLVAYYLLQRASASPEVGIDRVVSVVIWSVAGAVVAVLAWIIVFVVVRGLPKLTAGFFVHDMAKVGPLNPGGGAAAAIVGSFEQVGMAVVVVVPLALLTAIYLNEIRGRLASLTRFVVNALAGLPSIVAGLIVYSVWVANGHGFSGAAGSASLIVLMLPTVTRTSEEVLRIVPDPLREAALALGAHQWRVVLRTVVPTARAGLTTAVILGTALAIGETAPLILTTSNSVSINWNPFQGPQASLTLFIKTYVLEPSTVQQHRGFTAALVLLLLVGILFVTARYLTNRSARRLGRR